MDVSDEDSLFHFFADVPRARSHARKKSPTPTEPLETAPLAGCGTRGSQIRNVTVENERQIQTHRHKLLGQNQDIYSDDFSTAASLHSPGLGVDEASVPEYEDDFESTPSETSESCPTVSGREDSCVQGGRATDSSAVVSCSKRRHPTQMSPGHSQHNAARNIWNGSIRGCYHVTKAGGHKTKHSAERRTTDRRLQGSAFRLSGRKAGYKDINKRFDGKNTIHLTSSRSRKRGGNQHSSSSGTNSGSGRVKDAVDSKLSSDTSSDVTAGNYDDIHLNIFSEKMASRNKLCLPKVDRSGRVQLTRHRGDRSTEHRATGHHGNTASSKQPRTYVSMTGKDNVRSGSNRRQSRKPAIPIPLKSEALYCDGELSVNVRGDRRGNPDKNKFNVTITVVHKHTRRRPTPYLSRQTHQPRVLPRARPLDLDIVQHRAIFPGFNTSTDPEVNRRFLQQFGL